MGNINKTTPQGSHIDLGTGARIKNMQQSTSTGHPVEHDQLINALAQKQDTLTGGQGIVISDDIANIDISSTGTDYNTVTLSSMDYAILDGDYTRNSVKGYVSNAGLDLDYTHNAGNFSWFYKTVIPSISWAILAKRSSDGLNDSGSWMAVLTSTDPSTITGNVENLVNNYSAVSYDVATYSNELDEHGLKVPASSDLNVDYAVGSGASYLKVESGKLLGDAATNDLDASTGKIADAGWVKSHVASAIQTVDTAGEISFINTVASLPSNPTNVQSALESSKTLIDVAQAVADGAVSVNVDQGIKIDNLATSLGVSVGSLDMGVYTNPMIPDSDTQININIALADEIDAVDFEVHSKLGVVEADNAMGTMVSTIYSDDVTAKALLEEAGSAIEALQLGAGAFWSQVDYHHHDDTYPLPAGWENGDVDVDHVDDGADGGFFRSGLTDVKRVLIVGAGSDSGIYDWDTSTGFLVRSSDADASNEFTANKTVTILNGKTHAGATYAYTGTESPTIGTDNLTFSLRNSAVVGDKQVSEAKLTDTLLDKINLKTDKHAETVTIPSTGFVTVTHGLGTSDVVISVKDSTGNYNNTVEIDDIDSNSISLSSVVEIVDARIAVIG